MSFGMLSYEVLLWQLLTNTVNTSCKLQNVNIYNWIAICTISFKSLRAYMLRGEKIFFPHEEGWQHTKVTILIHFDYFTERDVSDYFSVCKVYVQIAQYIKGKEAGLIGKSWWGWVFLTLKLCRIGGAWWQKEDWTVAGFITVLKFSAYIPLLIVCLGYTALLPSQPLLPVSH